MQTEAIAQRLHSTKASKRVLTKFKLNNHISSLLVGAILPLFVLVVWQVLGEFGLISELFLPTPLVIAAAFKKLLLSGELWIHVRISLIRAGSGFLVGGSLGLLFGLLVGLFRQTERILDPTIQVLRLIPYLATAPLIILWFGFDETSKVVIIANGCFFPLYVNAFLGIRNVDNKLFEVAKVLQFNRFKQITRLILPASLPNIFLGVRISMGIAWIGLVVAELIGSQSGVGFLILQAKQDSDVPIIFVGILIFAVVGGLTDWIVRVAERRFLKWQDSFQG
ncbi:ABC transporter permease [Paenibacillus psychroresistens]|uniref:ABC transporter permease n=1 Tax=Paenibacillus psychroresistens TaxID=1778678 RepID=UPI003865493F